MGEKQEFEIDWKEIQNQEDLIGEKRIAKGVVNETLTNKLYTIKLFLTNGTVMFQEMNTNNF